MNALGPVGNLTSVDIDDPLGRELVVTHRLMLEAALARQFAKPDLLRHSPTTLLIKTREFLLIRYPGRRENRRLATGSMENPGQPAGRAAWRTRASPPGLGNARFTVLTTASSEARTMLAWTPTP